MKQFFVALFSFILVFGSCNKKSGEKFLPSSVGNINALQIVISNDLWNGDVGETIRKNFAAPADGLPQDEPLFSMSQMPPEAFVDFMRSNRIFILVQIGDNEKAVLVENQYAKPQSGAIIEAATPERLQQLIDENAPKIIEAFHKSEIAERQRRTRISMRNVDSMKQKMGISFQIPSAYRLAIQQNDFFWYRKDLKDGTTNIIVYEAPLDAIRSDSTAIGDIIQIRDSIGSRLLPVEDDDLFVTEDAYSPLLFKTEISGHFAYETRGTWEVTDAYMAGPFLNFAIRDDQNNRWLILEGWTYAPGARKRDLQFELESILLTAKLE